MSKAYAKHISRGEYGMEKNNTPIEVNDLFQTYGDEIRYEIKSRKNLRTFVGNRCITQIDVNGDVHHYLINEVAKIDCTWHHRWNFSKYTVHFTMGKMEVYDDCFEGFCLIGELKDAMEKNFGAVNKYFSTNRKEFYIENMPENELIGTNQDNVKWLKADDVLQREFKREARLECIIFSVIMLLIGCICYGCAIVWLNLKYWFTYVYWSLFILVCVFIMHDELRRSFGKVHVLKAIVSRKRRVLKKGFAYIEEFAIDIDNNDFELKNIMCTEVDYEKIVPGKSMVTIVTTYNSKPKIFGFCNYK